MNSQPAAARQWMEQHADDLLACRWGCKISPSACRSYQSRSARYVFHFNGDRNPSQRINAEYLLCFTPEPCPNLLSDKEARALLEDRRSSRSPHFIDRRIAQSRDRHNHSLVNPDAMLNEPSWGRSLVSKQH